LINTFIQLLRTIVHDCSELLRLHCISCLKSIKLAQGSRPIIEKSGSMTDEITLSESELPQIYIRIESAYELHLKKFGVKLPKLYRKADEKEFTIDAIVLCALAKYEGKDVPKSNLTKIVRKFYPETNDVQQARHLGRQKGWNIASGRRGDMRADLATDEYCLLNLTEPYPEFNGIDGPRSARGGKDFEDLKSKFDFRCATCGSLEGEANFLNSVFIADHYNRVIWIQISLFLLRI
jgi:hypothetical protein